MHQSLVGVNKSNWCADYIYWEGKESIHPNNVISLYTCMLKKFIARQMGHCMGVNFNIHIWAWSASPSVQVGFL